MTIIVAVHELCSAALRRTQSLSVAHAFLCRMNLRYLGLGAPSVSPRSVTPSTFASASLASWLASASGGESTSTPLSRAVALRASPAPVTPPTATASAAGAPDSALSFSLAPPSAATTSSDSSSSTSLAPPSPTTVTSSETSQDGTSLSSLWGDWSDTQSTNDSGDSGDSSARSQRGSAASGSSGGSRSGGIRLYPSPLSLMPALDDDRQMQLRSRSGSSDAAASTDSGDAAAAALLMLGNGPPQVRFVSHEHVMAQHLQRVGMLDGAASHGVLATQIDFSDSRLERAIMAPLAGQEQLQAEKVHSAADAPQLSH